VCFLLPAVSGAQSLLLLLQVVLQVKAAVEQLQPGTTYNSCLLNLYRDGSHHVSWHSDNEKL
jgi:alkylated DNA repair dioxygenase AlkB